MSAKRMDRGFDRVPVQIRLKLKVMERIHREALARNETTGRIIERLLEEGTNGRLQNISGDV